MSKYDTYTSPLAERNASPEMLRLWSPRHKFNTWRRIWLAIAEVQCCAGIHVTPEQVQDLAAVVNRTNADGSTGITDEEIRAAEQYEREFRHDVMAHVHAFGDACPRARGIIHLGCTSQDIVCNSDAIIIEEALEFVKEDVDQLICVLGILADRWKSLPCLGFTHFQPAQPVTVGRRCAQWAAELDLIRHRLAMFEMPLRGLRGATGTQASFQQLVDQHNPTLHQHAYPMIKDPDGRPSAKLTLDNSKSDTPVIAHTTRGVDVLEDGLIREIGFDQWKDDFTGSRLTTRPWNLTTQTYPRVIDTFILADLASTAAVLHKIASDIRLLCNRKELDEPFEDKQIGSSAMPYKRNPMRCERICGLARFVMNLVGNAYDTAATQWLERTLDDSSNRRLSLPEAFLALDGALDLMHNVASGLIVHEPMVRRNLMAELPFMATEHILMACVKAGGDRQHYHELLRVHSQAAGTRVKDEGLDNDLIDRLKNDPNFWSIARGGPLAHELNWDEGQGGLLDPMKYIGRSVEQTERFCKEVVEPLREKYGEAIAKLNNSAPRV